VAWLEARRPTVLPRRRARRGTYRQAGFGSGPTWSLRYEHRWNLGSKLALRYGLRIASHPYDGVRELQRGVFLNLSMPLQ